MHGVKHEHLSEADYLAQEDRAQVRHEYVDGQVCAMSGASIRHNRIAGNLDLSLDEVYAGIVFDPPAVREPEAGYEVR